MTVTDPLKSYGTIPAGDSSLNSGGFGLSVAEGLPDRYPVKCSVICRNDVESTWVSFMYMRVSAPVLEFIEWRVKDQGSVMPNGKLDPGETADLEVTIKNAGGMHAYNVRTVLRSTDPRLTVPDSLAVYGTVMVESLRTNTSDRFTLTASPSIPIETPIPCYLDVYADAGYIGRQNFEVIVGPVRPIDPIPDGPREPALYWAYDDMDLDYPQRPAFSWVEINALGTKLNFPNYDAVLTVDLPAGFGPFKYYGQRYTRLSVSADGWIAPGNYTTPNFANTALPSNSAPPGAMCANWDDLVPGYGNTGHVYYYHDAANHRFIVEYDSVAYYTQISVRDKFQFVFYDTTLAERSGNSTFAFQYLTANNYSANTVGIQDPTRTIGIQALLNGVYHPAGYPLHAACAIRFTTEAPMVGVGEAPSVPALSRRAMTVSPNPFDRGTFVNYFSHAAGKVELSAYDATGRQVGQVSFSADKGSGRYFWQPRELAPGIYFLKVKTPDRESVAKVLLTD